MSRPQAVVFDHDGLLVATEEAWTRADTALFAAHGREFTIDHKHAVVGTSVAVAGPLLEDFLDLRGHADELVAERHRLVIAEAETGCEPMPGAVEILDALQEAGTPMGLVSNSIRRFVDAAMKGAGLSGRLEVLLTPDDGIPGKPGPELYLEACRRLGAQPEMSVALEDSQPGVAAAIAARMTVVGIPSVPGVELEGADLLADSLVAPEVWEAVGLS